MAVPHIPCLRLGEPYVSLNQIEVTDYRDGATKATVSQVNAGVVRRDCSTSTRPGRHCAVFPPQN